MMAPNLFNHSRVLALDSIRRPLGVVISALVAVTFSPMASLSYAVTPQEAVKTR